MFRSQRVRMFGNVELYCDLCGCIIKEKCTEWDYAWKITIYKETLYYCADCSFFEKIKARENSSVHDKTCTTVKRSD
jgi:transcription initiation factor TFIIIB Brf1 subunit/transcription initiation factor TFIIB